MATTFYATNNFTGDGTTVNWNINFADGYIDTTNVKARYLDNTGSYVDIAISSVAGNVVTISPAVADGQEFQIYRDTEKRFPLVDFSDGAILNETNLDTLATQAVMVSAEAFDQSNNGVRIAGDSLVIAQGIDAKAQEALDNSQAAVATADGIAATANTALSNSQTALNTANDAKNTADGIAATANQALTNSNTAITTANGAVTTANAANSTANGIAATANSALTTANSAASDASTALSTANGVDAKAQTALDNTVALDAATVKKAANLSDIADKAAARSSLDVPATADVLLKADNLASLTDRAEAWLNVRPVGSTPLAANPVNALDATTKQWVEALRSVNESWSVVNTSTTTPPAGTSVYGGAVKSEYKVGATVTYQASLQAYGVIGQGAVNAGAAISNGTHNWFFNQSGGLNLPNSPAQLTSSRPDGALIVEAYLRPKDLVVQPLNSVGIAAAENNAMRMINYTNVGEGNFVNNISGDWYAGSWMFGGIRSGSTLLDRAQLNILNGGGASASYQFSASGVASCQEWRSTSDERIKSDIARISNPLAKMRNIKGVSWTMETNGSTGFGFIAQDVEKDFPEAVSETKFSPVTLRDGAVLDDVKSVNTSGVSAALHHEAILALMDKVEALEARIAELTSQ